MAVTIDRLIPHEDFEPPNTRIRNIEVFYTSEKGYKGSIHVKEAGATKETINKAVKEAAAFADSLIGSSVK